MPGTCNVSSKYACPQIVLYASPKITLSRRVLILCITPTVSGTASRTSPTSSASLERRLLLAITQHRLSPAAFTRT